MVADTYLNDRCKNLASVLRTKGVRCASSRIHRLHFKTVPDQQIFVKREDELGFGISGAKLRKYQSLIPYLKQQNARSALVVGGAYSNNVLSLCQVLIENTIQPFLFLKGKGPPCLQGNFLLTRLFVPADHICWIEPRQWEQVLPLIEDKQFQFPQPTVIIPEGACMEAALPGVATLALDILRNQSQLGEDFDHIFIEAGTGLAAIGLILGLGYVLKRTIHIHVVLLADTQEIFLEKLHAFHTCFRTLVQEEVPCFSRTVTCHFYTPSTAKSFGAVNGQVLHTIKKIAREEGFLTDPIYSAKLFFEAFRIIEDKGLKGNILITHSGGALTLMGFTHLLKNQVE